MIVLPYMSDTHDDFINLQVDGFIENTRERKYLEKKNIFHLKKLIQSNKKSNLLLKIWS